MLERDNIATGEFGEVHDPGTHLIPFILEAAAGLREGVTILGEDYPTPDGSCIRDYIHVEDLADAHVAALNHCVPRQQDQFNLSTGTGYSVRQVMDVGRGVTDRDFKVSAQSRDLVSRQSQMPIQYVQAPISTGVLSNWIFHFYSAQLGIGTMGIGKGHCE